MALDRLATPLACPGYCRRSYRLLECPASSHVRSLVSFRSGGPIPGTVAQQSCSRRATWFPSSGMVCRPSAQSPTTRFVKSGTLRPPAGRHYGGRLMVDSHRSGGHRAAPLVGLGGRLRRSRSFSGQGGGLSGGFSRRILLDHVMIVMLFDDAL